MSSLQTQSPKYANSSMLTASFTEVNAMLLAYLKPKKEDMIQCSVWAFPYPTARQDLGD